RVLRKAQVIVAAETEQAPAVAFQPRAFGMLDHAQATAQVGVFAFGRLDRQAVQKVDAGHERSSLLLARHPGFRWNDGIEWLMAARPPQCTRTHARNPRQRSP